MSDKPHGPVGEQLMRKFYGPSGFNKHASGVAISDDQGGQATPHATLIVELLDSRVPKNEREWAAAREIERLTAERDAAILDISLHSTDYKGLLQDLTKCQQERVSLRGALLDLRAHFHAAGRRPEECYEMSLIVDALKVEPR